MLEGPLHKINKMLLDITTVVLIEVIEGILFVCKYALIIIAYGCITDHVHGCSYF